MPAAVAPPYGAQAYWNDRFRRETEFEWLLPPESLTAPVREAMERSAEASAVKAKVSAYASAHAKDHVHHGHHHHGGHHNHNHANGGSNGSSSNGGSSSGSSSSNGNGNGGGATTSPKPKLVKPKPQRVLHIGCGSSGLSFHLGRVLVADPAQVTNVDYSRVAIDKCRRREEEMLQRRQDKREGREGKENREEKEGKEGRESNGKANGNVGGKRGGGSARRMKWREADLLSVDDMAALARESDGGFDVIVDKSTTDCMACTDDAEVELPLDFSSSGSGGGAPSSGAAGSGGSIGKTLTGAAAGGTTNGATNGSSTMTAGAGSNPSLQQHTRCKVHPLHLIAVQLAAVARPGVTRWVCVSYSEDRFPFLSTTWDSDPQATSPVSMLDRNALEKGLPDPSTLWRIERKEAIRRPRQQQHKDHGHGHAVHRPDVAHWLYVLVRTEVRL